MRLRNDVTGHADLGRAGCRRKTPTLAEWRAAARGATEPDRRAKSAPVCSPASQPNPINAQSLERSDLKRSQTKQLGKACWRTRRAMEKFPINTDAFAHLRGKLTGLRRRLVRGFGSRVRVV